MSGSPLVDQHRADVGSLVAVDGMLRPALIRASAGTGKTYRLTARLLRLLVQGAGPESILATTFTRKAAGEILDRVLLTLARGADETDPDSLAQLQMQVEIETLPRSICGQLIERLLANIHRLRICTLDSLFSQLARSYPFELGLPPAWRLTDEIEEAWLRERAIDSMIASLDRAEMTSLMSMLGKGETRRSVARELLRVVNDAYSRYRQCGPDVWKRLKVPKLPEDARLRDAIDAFRASQPTQKRLRDKLEQLTTVLENRDFASLVEDRLVTNIAKARRARTPVKYYRSSFPEGLEEAFDTIYQAAQSTALSLLRAQNEGTATVLQSYDHHVTQLKRAARSLSFEDIGVLLASHFRSLHEHDLARRMDGAVDHILLDEFQDTSPVQWQVLYPFASRAAECDFDTGGSLDEVVIRRSFFCVGDTKQAIYGWRGGVAEIFDAVTDQLPNVESSNQDQSFRSSPVIIDVVNATFGNLPRHPLSEAANSSDISDKSMHEARALVEFSRRFPRHHAVKREFPGHVHLKTSRLVDGADDATRKAICFEDAAEAVSELYRAEPGISIGVLTRTNAGVAQLIFLLERLGVEVSQEGGNPLTDSAAVEMVLSALMMAEHPGDGRWAFHLSASPLRSINGFGPDMVRSMVEQRGLAETVEFLAGHLVTACDARDSLRLKQLCHLALSYEDRSAPRLRDFVRMVREKRIDRPQAARVRVMTIHQAKGLEFDAVVLAELDAALTRSGGNCVADVKTLGEPPHAMSRYLNHEKWHFLPVDWQKAFGRQSAANMTEALCLLYVAMTRARHSLLMVMSPAKKREFSTRTPASLLFHALAPEEDPTKGTATLFERGDSDWHRHLPESTGSTGQSSETRARRPIKLLPPPPVSARNDPRWSNASVPNRFGSFDQQVGS